METFALLGGLCLFPLVWLGWLVAVRRGNLPRWFIVVGTGFLLIITLVPAYTMSRYLFLTEPLVSASQEGNAQEVERLLVWGADPNAPSEFGFPLQAAISGDHREVVWLLLRAGADPNAPSAEGKSPLRMAKARGDREIARMLREAGAR